MSAPRDYKQMAKNLHKENKTLKDDIKTQKTQAEEKFHELELICQEQETAYKKKCSILKEKNKTLTDENKTLQEELEGQKEANETCMEWAGKLSTTIQGDLEMGPDDILAWVEGQSLEAKAEKTHEDAVRMMGELQIRFNLLTEEMEKYKAEKQNSKKNKKQKGLSGQHRKEDCDEGNVRPFVECRCSAVSWANGLAQQCSRHWDKHEDGKRSHLCKTHHKLLVVDEDGKEVYTGSWGLYHQERPKNWGDHGLKVQNEWKKMIGKPINYKLKEADYNAQFPAMCLAVPSSVPRFDYPEKVNGPVAPVEDPEADEDLFSDDEEGAESSSEGSSVVEFSDDEEEAEEVAPVEKVEETPVVDEDPAEFPKQEQLDQLEALNSGVMAVDEDILEELREEKKEWEMTMTHEEAQGKESTDEDSGAETEELPDLDEPFSDDDEFECFQCGTNHPLKSAHYPFEKDEAWCFECSRNEIDAQNYASNCLKGSDDDEDSE